MCVCVLWQCGTMQERYRGTGLFGEGEMHWFASKVEHERVDEKLGVLMSGWAWSDGSAGKTFAARTCEGDLGGVLKIFQDGKEKTGTSYDLRLQTLCC